MNTNSITEYHSFSSKENYYYPTKVNNTNYFTNLQTSKKFDQNLKNSKFTTVECFSNKQSICDTTITIDSKNSQLIFYFINKHDNSTDKYLIFLKNDSQKELISKKINFSNLAELNNIEKLSLKNKNTQINLLIKKSKVQLLKAIEEKLKKTLGKKISNNNIVLNKQNKFIRYFKYISFAFMTIMGTLIGGVSSFLGLQGLLKLIFVGISAPISLAVGLILTVIESLLFLSFEVGMLKTALDIEQHSDAKKALDLDEDAISHINSIQILLLQAANISTKAELKNYNMIRESCNDTLELIKSSYKEEIKENKIQKFIRHAITAVGAILTVAGTYYMMSSLIVFLNTLFFISNPVGWGIIGIGLCTSLAFFLSMRGKAISNIFVPEIAQYKKLSNYLEKLEKYSNILYNNEELRRENEFLKEKLSTSELNTGRKRLYSI